LPSASERMTVTYRFFALHHPGAATLTGAMLSSAKRRSLDGNASGTGANHRTHMKVNGSDLPLDEIEAALPAIGVGLPSGSKLRAGNPVIAGTVRLSNAKLAGFGLGSNHSAIPALAGKHSGGRDTTIRYLGTMVRVAPGNTKANAIHLTIPLLGVVTGAGTVSPPGALDFDMTAGFSERGRKVPFAIDGTNADLKFVPNVTAMAGNTAKQAISRGDPREEGRKPRRREKQLMPRKKYAR
jgi:AsmA protein